MFGRLTVIYLNIQSGFVLNPDYLFLYVLEMIFKYCPDIWISYSYLDIRKINILMIQANNIDLMDVYAGCPELLQDVSISFRECSRCQSERYCVLGVLKSPRGLQIRDEMLSWLLNEYNVYCVEQEMPGKLFEYPALRFTQWLCTEKGCDDVLYVHTKGAGRPSDV